MNMNTSAEAQPETRRRLTPMPPLQNHNHLNLHRKAPNRAIPHLSAAIRTKPHHSAPQYFFRAVRLVSNLRLSRHAPLSQPFLRTKSRRIAANRGSESFFPRLHYRNTL